MRSPLTWAALLVVLAVEWGIFAWFDPSPVTAFVAIVLGAGLLALWPFLLVRSRDFVRAQYQLPKQSNPEATLKLGGLRADLEKVGCGQGVEQLKRLRENFNTLGEVLERRLDSGELTYSRYLGTGHQVYLAAIDNLQEVAVALTSVSTIDPDYINSRLAELHESGNSSETLNREIESLEQRRLLLDQQTSKVSDLIAQNEAAMTALANTATALADAKTTRGRASMDAEEAMAELEQLATRAGKYAVATRS